MSRLVVFTFLLLLPGLAVALVTFPDCSADMLGMWQWTFNSLNQSACEVAAYLQSTCNDGTWQIDPLSPGGMYIGPSSPDSWAWCKCSTVAYSLVSACGSCQGGSWYTWPQYSTNCTSIPHPSTFPNPVPNGIRVPKWALLDITVDGSWAPSKASAVGDTPEVGPGGLMGPSGVSIIHPVKKSRAGAIAGGTITGVAAIAAAGLTIFWRQRKRRQAGIDGAPQSPTMEARLSVSDSRTYAYSSQPMRLYDPNDSTTFPVSQGIPVAPEPNAPAVPMPTYNENGNTLPMQISRPGGYHGYPTV